MQIAVNSDSIVEESFSLKIVSDELRVHDIEIAKRLGFDRPRKIRELIKRHLPSLEELGRCPTVGRRPEAGGHAVLEFYLNKKQAIFIATKSETKEATAVTIEIIERFDAYERERQNAQQVHTPAAPRTLLEALRLAVDQAEQIEEMKPKVAAYARLAEADGSLCLTEAAKDCQMKPRQFIQWLSSLGWIYKRVGAESWVGYAEHTSNGDLEHKMTTLHLDDGSERIRTQVRVTAQGMAKLSKKLSALPRPRLEQGLPVADCLESQLH